MAAQLVLVAAFVVWYIISGVPSAIQQEYQGTCVCEPCSGVMSPGETIQTSPLTSNSFCIQRQPLPNEWML